MEETARGATPRTVVVACKHQPGIWMRIFKQETSSVPVLGGGTREEGRSVAIGAPVKINGPAHPFGQAPKYEIVDGYALTTNVPGDIARRWMEQNKDSALVRNDVIGVFNSVTDATSWAKSHAKVRSGIEGLDVGTMSKQGRDVPRDPRWPARSNPNLSSVSTDQRKDDAA